VQPPLPIPDPSASAVTRGASEPLHEQVRRLLEAEIRSGRIPVGSTLPPEYELSQRFGVSRATVRHALADMVASGMLRRRRGRGTVVLRRAPIATGARQATVGLVVPQLSGMFLAHILDGLTPTLHAYGYFLTVESSEFQPGGEQAAMDRLFERGVCALLLVPTSLCATPPEAFAAWQDEGRPLVFLDRYRPDVEACVVASDNLRGGYLLGRHLLQTGRSRVAVLVSRDYPSTSVADRQRGLLWALTDAGCQPDRIEEIFLPRDFSTPLPVLVREALRERFLAQRRDLPDALMCANDELAMVAMAVLAELGLRVPEDVAVTGFDDLPYAAYLTPPLTTVRQDAVAMGREAARLLAALLAGQRPQPSHVRLPVSLVVRGSTAATASHGRALVPRSSAT
jgi:DNA-binding LacI/PurR family transcriptional regulator